MISNWLNSYFQSIDWNSIITAVIFGGLGFLIKTVIDYYRERSIKKVETDLDIRKLLFENKLSFMFKTQQILLETSENISRLYNQLDHIYNYRRHRDKDHLSYALDAVTYHTIDLLEKLDKLNSAEVEIVISDFRLLKTLRDSFEQYLSDNGVWRDYQLLLTKLDSSSKEKVKKNSKEDKALTSIKNFSEELVDDFKEAVIDIGVEARNYPTLKETGIKFPSLKFDSDELRLNEQSLSYITILNRISDFIDSQQLIKNYSNKNK